MIYDKKEGHLATARYAHFQWYRFCNSLSIILQGSLPLNPQKFGAFNLSFAINTASSSSLTQTDRSTLVKQQQAILPRWLI